MRRPMLVPGGALTAAAEASEPAVVAILGSTGSIGCSALEVIRQQPDAFQVAALGAGRNWQRLGEQILEFRPGWAALADKEAVPALERYLREQGCSTKVLAGPEGLIELATLAEVATVLAAVVGLAGLESVLAALRAGKKVALANKESLVCGGALVTQALAAGGAALLPVDSEHSAIFQAWQGQGRDDVASLILTASGGPFLDYSADALAVVEPKQALQHPRWRMGPKITVDSATLVNKALELIEAYWLFGVGEDELEVLIHPQSIVHSLLRLRDGSLLAQLSVADMRGPIAYGLSYPRRSAVAVMPQLDLSALGVLEFRELDQERFPAVALAREALRVGQAASAVFNIANEVAVAAFLAGRLPFLGIVEYIRRMLTAYADCRCESWEDLIALEREISLSQDFAFK